MKQITEIFNKYFWLWLGIIIIIEFLSFLGYLDSFWGQIFFVGLLVLIFLLSLFKPALGIQIILAELIIGSKGYLFSWQTADSFTISFRLGLFLVIFLIWLIYLIKDRKILLLQNSLWKYLSALLFFIFLGTAIALIRGNELSNIFYDLNGYLFIGLVLPIFQFIKTRRDLLGLLRVFMAAIVAVVLKTFLLLFVFSHYSQTWVTVIYRWIRETGVGEITMLENGLARIFFQSHIYELVALILVFSLLMFGARLLSKKQKIGLSILAICLSSVVLISYSRSFWLALVFTFLLYFIASWLAAKEKLVRVFIFCLLLVVIFISGLALELGIMNIPTGTGGGISVGDVLITERTASLGSESALQSRFELLPALWQANLEQPIFGAGFGKTVTYETQDLRYLDMNNGEATYTTFSFEWGYLGLWLKLGIFGLFVYLLFLLKLIQKGIEAQENVPEVFEKIVCWSFIFIILLLIIIHATTPYLDHPLGFGIIFLAMIIFYLYQQQKYVKK